MKATLLLAAFFISAAPAAADQMYVAKRPVPPGKYWLKRYALADHAAVWSLELRVRDFPKARKEALEIFDRYDGRATIPVENMASSEKGAYQQFSFHVPRKNAAKALKRLRRLGTLKRLRQTPDDYVDIPEDLEFKLTRLRAERKAGGPILKRLTAVAAAIDEILGHLEAVKAARLRAQTRILFNVIIDGAGS